MGAGTLGHRKNQGITWIVKYAVENRIGPELLSNDDLTRLHDQIIEAGKTPLYAKLVTVAFKSAIRRAGLQSAFPSLSLGLSTYGIPLSEFPTALHADTIRLLDWRQQDRAEGRPRTLKKLQPLAAHHLELIISHIYGYSKTVLGLPEVNSLKELLRKDLVENYVRWNRKRRIDGDSFRKKMNFLYASIKHFPQFADQPRVVSRSL